MENKVLKTKGISNTNKKYRNRKFFFWTILSIILLLITLFTFRYCSNEPEERYIRVAVCGCVKQPAVYTMRESSDLAMLVTRANGFKLNADVLRVDLDKIVKHDSVYHIPCKKKEFSNASFKLVSEINTEIKRSYTDLTNQVVAESNDKEIKFYSILYVGIPAVFVLINYYPEYDRINFVHIPHSTLFLNNEYRLIDLFFTVDIYPTMRIIENRLKQKIDFYLIQDRFNFIDLINMLGGVNVKLDKPYAEEYKFSPGANELDGFHAWEYIRFLDWKNLPMLVKSEKKKDLVRLDNFSIDPRTMERIYEMRNQRQRHVLEAMRRSFLGMSKLNQLDVVDNFKDVFRTDMTTEFLMELYSDLLSTPNFSYGNIPGYYSAEGDKLFFYPDMPSFELLKRKEIRTYLENRKNKTQTIY
jgi:hypothetical protein